MFYGITQLYKNFHYFDDKKNEDILIETMALNWGTTKCAIRNLFNTIRNLKTR